MAGFKLIKIFTDTNIIHTAQSHLLISSAVSSYIAEHKEIESVELKWYLPSMVLEERRHQMTQAAIALNPKIQELEKLLGHSLGFNEEIMGDRVDSKIKKTVESLGLEICDVDVDKVNWEELIQRSVERKAPFEISNSKEKGFRDAVIATSFLQEVSRSPITPRSCLLVFVSGDIRIREYIEEKTKETENIRLIENLDDLKSLLNAIASEVTEEFLKEIFPKAQSTFYDFEKEVGLYSKGEIFKKISETYQKELNSVVANTKGDLRRDSGVTISQQTFIEKIEQTVVWSTTVILRFEVIKIDFEKITMQKGKLGSKTSDSTNVISTGESHFSVIWQHQISTKGNIIKPKFNEIIFKEHKFDSDKEI